MKAVAAGIAGLVAGAAITFVLMVALAERAAERAERHGALREDGAPGRRAAESVPAERGEGEPRPLAAAGEAVAAPPAGAPASDPILGLVVYGRLMDMSGAPVDGSLFGIQFLPDLGAARRVDVSPDGTYAVTGLQPGEWIVTAGGVGYRTSRATLVLDAARPVTRFDVVVEPVVRLVVSAFTPDGRPLLDALRGQLSEHARFTLRLSALASREPITSLPTQYGRGWDRWGIGWYIDRLEAYGDLLPRESTLPPHALGWLDVSESLPVHVTLVMRNAILASQRVEPGQAEVVFHVAVTEALAELASLSVRFLDERTHAPLPGVHVDVADVQISGGEEQASDAQGSVRLEGLLPGGMRLEAGKEGYELLVASVTLPPGRHTDLGDVLLGAATSISGTVVDEEGRPTIASLGLRAIEGAASLALDYDHFRWSTDTDGTFTIERLGPHRFALQVVGEDRVGPAVLVDTRSGDVSGVVVRAEAGQPVSVRLDWPATRELGLRVVSDAGFTLTDWDRFSGDFVWTRRLARGRYVAECFEGNSVLERLEFDVDDAPVALEIGP